MGAEAGPAGRGIINQGAGGGKRRADRSVPAATIAPRLETHRRLPLRPWLIAGGAAVAALPAFLAGIEAWPEIVVPAYFTMRGRVLYDTIVFPHTPLLILTTALLGALARLSPLLFRAMIAVSMAGGAAGVIAGSRKAWLGLAAGVPAYVIWCAYAGGITLWPDPLMAPLVLCAALALERRSYRTAALCLGICILTKQTSA